MSALFTSREQGSDTHYSRRVKEDRSGKRHHRGGTKERFRFREGYAAEARRSERRREREGAKSVRRVEEIERKGRRWERRGLTFPTGYPPLPPTLLTYGLILNFQRV